MFKVITYFIVSFAKGTRLFKQTMGAVASINAASKKYKPSEPIEVKFHNVVKYDDGDEKAFKGERRQNP